MGYAVNHEVDAVFNKRKFKEILNQRKLKAKEVFKETIAEYGLDLEPKSFYNLTNNYIKWNLIYAICFSRKLNVPIEELFDLQRAGYKD